MDFIVPILSLIVGVIDPIMAIWIAVIIIAGYWIKRAGLPSWTPPLPIILLLLMTLVSIVFGWIKNEADGWKGLVYVLLYGLGNGIAFTGLAFILYDVTHAILKKKNLVVEETKTKKEKEVDTDLKLKSIIYGSSALGVMLIAWLLIFFLGKTGVLYSIFWSVLAGGLAAIVARIVFHLVKKDNTPVMWATSLYLLFACIGWLIAVISTTWFWASIGLAISVIGTIMAVGFRYFRNTENSELFDKLLDELEQSLRYELVDGKIGGTEDLKKPLILKDGNALTVAEARSMGLTELADSAIKYIKKIIKENK